MGCTVPGDASPRRAGRESPSGCCQEKPPQNLLPALLSPDGFHSALPLGTRVIFQPGMGTAPALGPGSVLLGIPGAAAGVMLPKSDLRCGAGGQG